MHAPGPPLETKLKKLKNVPPPPPPHTKTLIFWDMELPSPKKLNKT